MSLLPSLPNYYTKVHRLQDRHLKIHNISIINEVV